MDVSLTYCGDHLTIFVNQTIMLYTLNLHSVECQVFLKKTGRERERESTHACTREDEHMAVWRREIPECPKEAAVANPQCCSLTGWLGSITIPQFIRTDY